MSDRSQVFIDTNILIYRSFGTPAQKEKIQKLLILHEKNTYISVQVLNEFIHSSLKKKFFSSEKQLVEALSYFSANLIVASIDIEIVLKANFIRNRYHLAHYDSVILATALANKCDILYSEDMQHHLIIEKSLKIVNPFR